MSNEKPHAITADEGWQMAERIGWNPPPGAGPETVNVRCLRLQEHLKAVIEGNVMTGIGYCDWCTAHNGHDDDCPWVLARAYLDSLEAK